MQPGDQHQRRLNRQARVRQTRPCGLVVGLDGRPILSQGELKADVAISVAVGNMMHNLAHGPSAVAVRRIKLGVAKSVDGRAKSLGQQTQSLNLRGANLSVAHRRRTKPPNGITQILLIGHGKNLPRAGASLKRHWTHHN